MKYALTLFIALSLSCHAAVDVVWGRMGDNTWSGTGINRVAVWSTFTPLSLSGCTLWLDGTDSGSVTLDGTNVNAWADKSPSGSNAVYVSEASRPAYETCPGNGLCGLVFNGYTAEHYLDVTFDIQPEHTLFIVAASFADTLAYSSPMAYDNGAGADRGAPMYVKQSSRKSAAYPLWDSGYWDGDGAATYAVDEVFAFSFVMGSTGQTVSGYKNGALDKSFTSTASNTGSHFRIGISNSGQQWIGRIFEIVYYDHRLTDVDRKKVESYLGRKYGLTITP